MAKNSELRGLILGQFDSEGAFAGSIGWTKQKLSRITTGKQPPSLQDVQEIADGLSVPFMTVATIFLPKKSTIA